MTRFWSTFASWFASRTAPGSVILIFGPDLPSDRDAALGEQLEERDPMDACGLHRHRLDAAPTQPVRQGVEVRGERAELPHVSVLGIAPRGDCDVVALGNS